MIELKKISDGAYILSSFRISIDELKCFLHIYDMLCDP